MKSLISVIVPIYNKKQYLERCINSIINQTYKNLEIILVDDGSTDGSEKIVDNYAKKDKRVIVIHQRNGGQSRARNAGIEKSRGQFISFVDSDDEISPNFYEKLFCFMPGSSLAVCGVKYKKLGVGTENDVYLKKPRTRRKNESLGSYVSFLLTIDGRMYSSCNKLFRADIIRNSDLRFETGRNFAEDTKFVLDYLKCVDGEISFIPEPLYIYNYGTENSTIKKSGKDWNNWARSYKDLKHFVGKKFDLSESFWLFMVFIRWKISYFKTKLR